MARHRTNMANAGRVIRRVTVEASKRKAVVVHQKVHLQVADGLIFRTPVGNPDLWKSPPPPGYTGGRARGNWQSTVNRRRMDETGAIDPSGSRTSELNRGVALRIGEGDVSYVQNNVPYIQRLNDGWSSQMAAQFVEATVQEVAAQF